MEELPGLDRDVYRLDAQLLADLWIFRAAARFGSITEAARSLNVTQGAVSQRVLRLEGRLGTQLFTRAKGRLAITEPGAGLLDAMTQVASVLNDALSRIERQQRSAIVVSCLPSLATEWLVPNLEGFYLEHPGIEIFVRSELLPATAERLQDDEVDLAIDYSPAPPQGLHELAAIPEYIFPVCAKSYLERIAELDRDRALMLLHDDVPWIGGAAGDEWRAWQKEVGAHGFEEPLAHRHFNLAHLAYHAAVCGQGVAVGRATVVHRLMQKGELVEALDYPPVAGPTYRVLSHRPGDARSSVRTFAKWWARAMAETQAQTLALLDKPRKSDRL